MNEYSFLPTITDKHILLEKYSKLTAQLLLNRKIENLDDAEKFLSPQWSDNHDPFLLHDMEKSIKRFYDAVKNNEKITIYADYDADGIPGSIVLANLLEKINYENFDIYIPHRHDEGYGIHIPALEKIKESGTALIITIDVGITAHDAADWSVKNAVDMIITDHHLPLKKSDETQNLPESFALINPKQTLCEYPDPMLCGCGVIFKFVQAFVKNYGEEFNIHPEWEKWLLDMVGISTISDMVPLQNENRIFASFGLKVIQEISKPRNNHRIGLKKLLWDSGINAQYMTEEDIAFGITPRINAAS
ncbi:MAG: DHH family phosphoesterase, partial [Candidatus Pacebacteria bacterium]|nr:DHH family phosphoesterase [Candidatus Paceibacterota bacterium]